MWTTKVQMTQADEWVHLWPTFNALPVGFPFRFCSKERIVQSRLMRSRKSMFQNFRLRWLNCICKIKQILDSLRSELCLEWFRLKELEPLARRVLLVSCYVPIKSEKTCHTKCLLSKCWHYHTLWNVWWCGWFFSRKRRFYFQIYNVVNQCLTKCLVLWGQINWKHCGS